MKMNCPTPILILPFLLLFLSLLPIKCISQNKPSRVQQIIRQISELEQARDPKCYATANRLEDFMYGTPLTEDARQLKFDIQKAIVHEIRIHASNLARKTQNDLIQESHLKLASDDIAGFMAFQNGSKGIQLDTGILKIKSVDFRQYSSVAYVYRVILSLEQDIFLAPSHEYLPWSNESLNWLNTYLNTLTLAVLQIGDQICRQQSQHSISYEIMQESWLYVLKHGASTFDLSASDKSLSFIPVENDHSILREIINSKMASYETYNELNSKLFLRNVQVFLARQKWPIDEQKSEDLKNIFINSMVNFVGEFLRLTELEADRSGQAIIRQPMVMSVVDKTMPFEANQFEDITYYPRDKSRSITIESYDLDAFRDSGIHWKLLEFGLDQFGDDVRTIDPQAAELFVEGIAQMAVLVLRIAGEESHLAKRERLHQDDLTNAWSRIQTIIADYPQQADTSFELNSGDVSLKKESVKRGFFEITEAAGVSFTHKSADWLNRFIRSYVFEEESNLVKLAIPPAFGGSGVAAEDVNNDGLIDILLLGGQGNKLYLNLGKGQFKDVSDRLPGNHFNDELGSINESRQPIIADFDNDGNQDIVITRVNANHKVYKNEGDANFLDVSDVAKLGGEGQVAGPATAFDANKDGLLDIYIGYFGNYLNGTLPTLSRYNQNADRNRLFVNRGNFRFEEVEYLPQEDNTDNGWTQAAGHSDIDRDGWQDIIVGNDFGVNRYYRNLGNGMFKEMSREWGTDKPSYTMNIGIADLNQDQFPDFYISNIVVMQKDEKYINPSDTTSMKFDPEKMQTIRTVEANDLFISKTRENTLDSYELSENIGRGYSATGWSWDADFFDYDNDGDEDLYVLNGMNDFRVYSSENPFYYIDESESATIEYAKSERERNIFFVNDNGNLVNKAEELGLDIYSNSRSAAYLDFDNDGDLDIVINNYHDQAVLLENRQDSKNNWLKIRLVGDPYKGICLDAIGANVIAILPNGEKIWREVHSTTGYLSVHSKTIHLGIGAASKVSVQVNWPNGDIDMFENVDGNRLYEIYYQHQD